MIFELNQEWKNLEEQREYRGKEKVLRTKEMTLAKAAVVGSMLENKVTQLEGKRRIKCIKQFWEARLERETMVSRRWFPFLMLLIGYLVSAALQHLENKRVEWKLSNVSVWSVLMA